MLVLSRIAVTLEIVSSEIGLLLYRNTVGVDHSEYRNSFGVMTKSGSYSIVSISDHVWAESI